MGKARAKNIRLALMLAVIPVGLFILTVMGYLK